MKMKSLVIVGLVSFFALGWDLGSAFNFGKVFKAFNCCKSTNRYLLIYT